MTTVIKILGFANGAPCPHAGQFLKSFDHNANDGRGSLEVTPDPVFALKFEGAGSAFSFWRQPSGHFPIRPDGRPNRPLTGSHCTFLTLDDAIAEYDAQVPPKSS